MLQRKSGFIFWNLPGKTHLSQTGPKNRTKPETKKERKSLSKMRPSTKVREATTLLSLSKKMLEVKILLNRTLSFSRRKKLSTILPL
jgi:hypothetical protein